MKDAKAEKRRKTEHKLNNFERLTVSDSETNLWKSGSDESQTSAQFLIKNALNFKNNKQWFQS